MEPSACLRIFPGTIIALPNLRSRPSLSELGEMATVGDVALLAEGAIGAAVIVATLAVVGALWVIAAALAGEAVALEFLALFVEEVFAVAELVFDAIGVTSTVGVVLFVAEEFVDEASGATDCGGFAFANSSTSLDGLFETGQKKAANPAKQITSNRLQNNFITPLALNCQPREFGTR
jgi:hypothetical protein